MAKQSNFPTLWKQIHQYRSYAPSLPVISAITLLLVGGAVLLALPDNSDEPQRTASASAAAPSADTAAPATSTDSSAADDTLCEKQAWPYIDQRCAQRVEAARDTRQVRIVTDKGNSVNVVTPVPIVEPKAKPAPQRPVVAQNDAPVIGPAVVAPQVPENAPQIEKVAEAPPAAPAPQNPAPQPQAEPAPAPAPAPKAQTAAAPQATPAATDAMARDAGNRPAKVQNAAVEPAAMSDSPVSAGVDAIEAQPKKSKAELKREARREARESKQARREAKRRALEQDGAVPDEVVATVRGLPTEGQSRRRGRGVEVPDEVLAAVERAAARETGRRGGRVVTVGSPNGGERMYIVPADRGGW